MLSAEDEIWLTLSQLDDVTRERTNLIDPTTQEYLTDDQIEKKAKSNPYYKDNIDKETATPKPQVTKWPETDEECIEMFPFRSNADAPFRRARMLDLRDVCPVSWLNDFRNLDYITIVNLLFARLIHGERAVTMWKKLNMLQSLNNFIIGANSLNLVMKKYKCEMTTRLLFAETANLTGYRQMPMPGFDIVKETKALCDGGDEHGIVADQWEQEFEEAAKEVMAGQDIAKAEWVTLEEYIKHDLASTAGASSIGKVHYTYKNETGKFKARKNLLYDIMTPEQIYKVVVANYDHQVATAFVKPEMGKLRIAVTGDIESYYVCSWLNYLAGHSYTTWVGNTLEESRTEQMRRMQTTLDQLIDNYSIPFDYKGFDHQPTLREIAIELRLYLSNALYNTPVEWKDYVSTIIDIVIQSFFNSVTVVRDEKGKKWVFQVKGGVQSGVRLTSLLGNFWNQIMTRIVTKTLGSPKQVIDKYIRGDDSSIITMNYEMALLFRLGYAAINAVGADAKYGIHRQETEFLRIWYANNRVYGYPNRAIPSLTQRKPWTSDPWDPEGVVAAQVKTVRLLERRLGRELPRVEQIVCSAWSRKRKMTQAWLRLPKAQGGLGILPWKGWLADKKYPEVDVEAVKVKFTVAEGTANKYVERLQASIPQTPIVIDHVDALQMQQAAMRGKASSDDLPGLNRILRQGYNETLKKFRTEKVEWRSVWTKITVTQDMMSGLRSLETLQYVDDLKYVDKPKLFGKYIRTQNEWRGLAEAARYNKVDIHAEYIKYAPGFFADRAQLEKAGMHRTMATDWLFGTISRYSASYVHDQAAATVEQAVAGIIEQDIKRRTCREMWMYKADFIWRQAEKSFARSRLNERLLMY